MNFWEYIQEGCQYYEKNMFDYADKSFDKAIQLRKDGEFLVNVIRGTRNFNYIFPLIGVIDNEESFDRFFEYLHKTIAMNKSREIEEDTYKYIIEKLIDIKTIFIKTVARELIIIASYDESTKETLIIYDKYKDYLKRNKSKICEKFKDIDNKYTITSKDIDTIIAWCYVILLNDSQQDIEHDNGYTVSSSTWSDGSYYANTTSHVRHDTSYNTYRTSRMSIIGKDINYHAEYIKEFKVALEQCGVSINNVYDFQIDFESNVLKYVKNFNTSLLQFNPFVKKKILVVPKETDYRLGSYLGLCGFLGALGAHCFYIGKKKRGITLLLLTLTGFGTIVSVPMYFYDFFRALIKKELPSV